VSQSPPLTAFWLPKNNEISYFCPGQHNHSPSSPNASMTCSWVMGD
jgi:hypothetical protein